MRLFGTEPPAWLCPSHLWFLLQVGNNIPVFFVRDAIKFPDLVHSLKPSPRKHVQVSQCPAMQPTGPLSHAHRPSTRSYQSETAPTCYLSHSAGGLEDSRLPVAPPGVVPHPDVAAGRCAAHLNCLVCPLLQHSMSLHVQPAFRLRMGCEESTEHRNAAAQTPASRRTTARCPALACTRSR